MTNEELKNLGLTDEQVEKVIEDYGKKYVTKSQFNEKNEEAKQLKSEVTTLKSDFEKLTATNEKNEELVKQIESMQKESNKREKEYEKTLHTQRVNSALDLALVTAKAKNTKAVKALLDLDKAELNEDGTIKGLDEQLKAVAESDPYLFEKASTTVKGIKPGDVQKDVNSGGLTREEFNKMTYQERINLYNENKEQYEQLSKGE